MRLFLLLLSITTLMSISSCGKDDTVEIVNELFLDGTSLVGEHGIAVEVGADEDHYEFSFAISDGDLHYNTSSRSFQFSTSSNFFLSFGAASLGSNQFNTGIFQFRSSIDSTPDDHYFFSGTFIDIPNSSTLSVTDGTITITGTSPNYTLQFDLTLTGNKKLTGAFVGTFDLK